MKEGTVPFAFDLMGKLRKARDQGMESWAKTAIQLTSSEPYARANYLLSQPWLIAAGIFRKSREKAMSQVLAQLNMPSREEVLGLSQRLTHIEMVLDDLVAAIEAARSAPAEPEAPRAAQGNGARVRPLAAGVG